MKQKQAAKKAEWVRWREYEIMKSCIAKQNLSPREYEGAIRALAVRMGL